MAIRTTFVIRGTGQAVGLLALQLLEAGYRYLCHFKLVLKAAHPVVPPIALPGDYGEAHRRGAFAMWPLNAMWSGQPDGVQKTSRKCALQFTYIVESVVGWRLHIRTTLSAAE